MPARKDVQTAIGRIARKCRLEPQLVEDAYPCTGLQASLVAASLQGTGDYITRFVFDLSREKCGPDSVRQACEHIYHQHAILRSRVIENGGQFLQVVVKEPLRWVEAESLQRYLDEDHGRSIALGEPMAKFAWIQEPQGNVYMVWSVHHCQYDGWSFDLILTDLRTAASNATEVPRRTALSKFVKALSKIDSAASHEFWKGRLQDCSNAPGFRLASSRDVSFRTSQRCEQAFPLETPCQSPYQPSVLAVAAWSLLVSHLAGSSRVLFGHVLSGRTFDLEGIQEVCGPTLTTVPWMVEIPIQMRVRDFLDHLQDLRAQTLPFEQTGLDEYRKIAGAATFDTLLSVRYSQDQQDVDPASNILLPQQPDARDLSHPCCIFFEVDMDSTQCRLKASYDNRFADEDMLLDVMSKFVTAFKTFPLSLEQDLGSFADSLQLTNSLKGLSESCKILQEQTHEDAHQPFDVDPKIIQKIQELAAKVSGLRDTSGVGPETTLFQLGMDSLKTVVLSNNLSKAFGVNLPFKDIAGQGRSLASIGRVVQKVKSGADASEESASTVSLLDRAETYIRSLAPAITEATHANKAAGDAGGTILLTGATGYLGIEILRQCLNDTKHRFILLVRCTSAIEGLERLDKSARMAMWTSVELEKLHGMVEVWASDLSQERLGLSDKQWQALNGGESSSLSLRAIIHNGAKVDFLQTYDDLQAVNVRSTAILLGIQARCAHRPSFVFVTGGRPCPLTPDGMDETAARLSTTAGYAQTKFVSEVLLHRARTLYHESHQPVHMAIVHPGAIIGSASTGVANTDDFIWRYVAASLGMGRYVTAVPTKREWINLTPVDAVAAVVVAQAFCAADASKAAVNRCLVRRGLSVERFWATIVDALGKKGHELMPASEWEWLRYLEDDLEKKKEGQPLFTLSQLLLQGTLRGIGGQPPAINPKTGTGPETLAVEAALRSNVEYLYLKDGAGEVFVRSKT